jgi:hypothetical protein
MEATEGFPGAKLWSDFDDSCKKAEVVRNCATAEATRERDRVVNSLPGWDPTDRVKAAASARYDRKVVAAQTKCDEDCKYAEKQLMTALDQREGNEARARRVAHMATPTLGNAVDHLTKS